MFQYSGFVTMAISYLVRSEGCARVWSWIRSSHSLIQRFCTNWVFSVTTDGISACRSQICTAFDLYECIISKPFNYKHPCGGRHEHFFGCDLKKGPCSHRSSLVSWPMMPGSRTYLGGSTSFCRFKAIVVQGTAKWSCWDMRLNNIVQIHTGKHKLISHAHLETCLLQLSSSP